MTPKRFPSPHAPRLPLTLVALFGLLWGVAGCGTMSDAESFVPARSDAGPTSPRPYADAGAYAADAAMAPTPGQPQPDPQDHGKWLENDFVDTSEEDTSTFSIDVDTASYTQMRQALKYNSLPSPDTVRVEEFINYFEYTYPQPQSGPFSINMEGADSYFGSGFTLMHIGLQGLELEKAARKPANLVFLIDISGSMGSSNKLPLVKKALLLLLDWLQPTDTLGIVTYSSTVNELVQPSGVSNKAQIAAAINSLQASGGTAGGPGIQTAYAMAKKATIKGGINRVILCTDGDFNVGLRGSALVSYVEQQRKDGVTLSVLGFGMGNYQDSFLEDVSNKGNGNYAYIDSEAEAKKVFGDRLLSTLQVIAKDVKVQVQFNAAAVQRYRLIGYENRLLQNKDFKDDTKDAGEIGAGHSVTALYELELAPAAKASDLLATLRFRYKEPEGTVSKELSRSLSVGAATGAFVGASNDFRFSAAVAEFAEILRRSKHSAGARFADVKNIAGLAAGTDKDRQEFLTLVDQAKTLWTPAP